MPSATANNKKGKISFRVFTASLFLIACVSFGPISYSGLQFQNSAGYSVTISTDSQVYSASDVIHVFGSVTPPPGAGTSAFIQVYNPDRTTVAVFAAPVNGTIGRFSVNFTAGGTSNWVAGIYSITATWALCITCATYTASTTFTYSESTASTSFSSSSTLSTTTILSSSALLTTTETVDTSSASSFATSNQPTSANSSTTAYLTSVTQDTRVTETTSITTVATSVATPPETSTMSEESAITTTQSTTSFLVSFTKSSKAGGVIEVFGNLTSGQISGMQIQSNATESTFVLKFNVDGLNGTRGTFTLAVPKSIVPDGLIPQVYVDGNLAPIQLFSENSTGYYVTITTHFSSHAITIIFDNATKSSSATLQTIQINSDTNSLSSSVKVSSQSWTIIVDVVLVALALATITGVLVFTKKRNR